MLDAHRVLINKLESGWDFYTFTPRTQKQHAYVLRGLGSDVTAGELQVELSDLGLGVQKFYKLNNTRATLFMVRLEPGHTPATLNMLSR